MTTTTNDSKKEIPMNSVISDPVSRAVLFLILLKWFVFWLFWNISYYLLDSTNAKELKSEFMS